MPDQLPDTSQLILPLRGRGDKLVAENIPSGEKLLVKLPGNAGQALVLTVARLYIVKWGWLAGKTFGGKCIGYEYRNISAIEVNKHAITYVLQILTPATQHQNLHVNTGYGKGTNVTESDFAIDYSSKAIVPYFQTALVIARYFIDQAHSSQRTAPTPNDNITQLERLAALKERGVITDREFQAKKQQLLGL